MFPSHILSFQDHSGKARSRLQLQILK